MKDHEAQPAPPKMGLDDKKAADVTKKPKRTIEQQIADLQARNEAAIRRAKLRDLHDAIGAALKARDEEAAYKCAKKLHDMLMVSP